MILGKLRFGSELMNVFYPDRVEERITGLNNLKLKDNEAMIYLYCCPTYVMFKGCDDRNIDIAFLKRSDKDFIISKIISPLTTGEVCSADKIEGVLEVEYGILHKKGFSVGSKINLMIEVNGSLRDITELYKIREDQKEGFKTFLENEYNSLGLNEVEASQFLFDLFQKLQINNKGG